MRNCLIAVHHGDASPVRRTEQLRSSVQVFGAGADEKFVMRGRLTGCSVG
jgi:hypothetical protein